MNQSLLHLSYWNNWQQKDLLLLLLIGLTPFSQALFAQIIHANGIVGDTLIIAQRLDCTDSQGVLYQDDNEGGVGIYDDLTARKDTVSICPATSWEAITLNFTAFDLAEGDTLFAFDGNKEAVVAAIADINNAGLNPYMRDRARLIGIGSGSGVGVSKGFGGWIGANCDPARNASGCLTFIFKTNGDNIKGKGWEAWASCASRTISLNAGINQDYQASCSISEPAPIASVPVTAANISGSCILMDSTVRVTISNLHTNTQCLQENAKAGAAIPSSPIKLAPGFYQIIHALVADTLKRDTQYIKVNGPNLVCNDEVNIAIDALCRTGITLDGLIETDTCVGSSVSHHLIIKNNAGKIIAQGRNLALDTVQIEGVCGESQYTATVVRTFRYANSTALCKPDSIETFCEVKLNFIDETVPVFDRDTARVDTLVGCDPSLITEKILTPPIPIDNCGDTLEPTFTIIPFQLSYGDCEYPREYFIKWEAADSCQNAATPIMDTLRMIRPTEFSNPSSITEDCTKEENGLLPLVSRARVRPGLRTGKMVNGVFSASGTMRLSLDTAVCKYIAVILDSTEVYGPCGKRFAEMVWGYVDLCNPNQAPVLIDTQAIKFIDETAPSLSDSTLVSLSEINDSTSTKGRFDISSSDCILDFSNIAIPVIPKATDNCAAAEDVKVIIKNIQQLVNGKWDTIATDLEAAIAANLLTVDTFRVAYEASENCSKKTSQVFTHFLLENNDSTTAPEIICEDALNISIPNNAGVFIRANDLIIDTTAACNRSIAAILVRRKGQINWDSTVLVTCNDIGIPFAIEVQVSDDKGNQNTCWTNIIVEDKIVPLCSTLPDTMGVCSDFHTEEFGATTDLNENGLMDDDWVSLANPYLKLYNETFGDPLALCQDNIEDCKEVSIIQQYQLIKEACGITTIKRRYRAKDAAGNESAWIIQLINIKYEPAWVLQFPADKVVKCGEAIPDTTALADILTTGACDVFGYTVTDKVFEVNQDACLKIERRYELINWCVYQAGGEGHVIPNDPNGNARLDHTRIGAEVGRYIYTQVIKLEVDEAPEITINPVQTCIYGVGDTSPFGEADDNLGTGPYECDTLRTFSASGSNCLKQPIAKFEHSLKVDGQIIINKGEGDTLQIVVEPNKKYEITFWAFDDCGNSREARDTYQFKDCTAPSIYLIDGIALTLGERDSVQLWAADLDNGSWDNCTPKNQLDRRIVLGSPTLNSLAEVKALKSVISLSCTEIGKQAISVYWSQKKV